MMIFDFSIDQSTGFRLAALLVLAVLTALAYRLRVARLRARERTLIVLIERRTAEARAAQEAAEQANRAKDQFLAVLSHELRTPLTPVLLSVGTLLEEDLAPEVRGHLEMIRRNVELEARLVDDLLDVARIERGQLGLELELVDVHEVIARALEICFGEVFTAEVEVVEDLAALVHHARADYARLMQVFWNLIRNAVKFASPGMKLTIRSYNEHARPAGLGSGPGPELDNPLLVVEFHDTGIGIEPDMLDRIFEPFERGDEDLRRRGGGLGLGLAIARAVAEAHGGRLTAASPGRGQGATFRLELAAAAPRPGSSGGEPPADVLRHRPANLRVLLVEDNIDTLRYLDLTLSRHGYQVTGATTVADARRAVANGAFDLLISDIELPDGSGLELMRELRHRGIPGIALSGYGSEEDVCESQEAGFVVHLLKPVLADALDKAVCRAATTIPGRDGQAAAMSAPAPRMFAGSGNLVQPIRGPSGV
jgi:signal transduction histidine kinase/CheY-like chemotaxis protein